MNNELISVALCTYNGAAFLAEQLQSILDQTYKNLEIIVVDDCSTDGSCQLARKFAEKDSRVKVFCNKENLGFNKNFEKAISLTSGRLIAISDQDDIWELDKLQRLHDNIGDNWLVFSNSALIYPNGRAKKGRLLDKFKYNKPNYRSILLGNFVTGHTCLMTRELVDRIMPFPKAGYYDWWMGFVALYHNKLTYLPQMLTRYRVHERSVTQQEFNDKASKRIFFDHTLVMLDSFLTYPNLQRSDLSFIKRLRNALGKKLTTSFNPVLAYTIGNHYSEFFPNMKKRSWLSAFNFARKYARKLA